MDGTIIIKKKGGQKGGKSNQQQLDDDFVGKFIEEMLINHSDLTARKVFVVKVKNEKMGNISIPKA